MTPEEIEDLLFAVDASRIGKDSARRIIALIAEERAAYARHLLTQYPNDSWAAEAAAAIRARGDLT